MEQEERIKKYLTGPMSAPSQKEFETDLATDVSLKDAFNEYKEVQDAYKLIESAQLKERFKKLEQTKNPFYKRLFYNKYLNLAYASVVVIGLFVVLNMGSNNTSLYASYSEAYPNVYQPITRGEDETEATLAFQLYENNNFVEAELEFVKLLAIDENSHYRFYYAQCLLQNKKFDAALIELEGLKTITSSYAPEIYWYSALIHIQKSNTLEAKSNLKTLIDLNSKFKQKEAKEIIKKIN